MNDVRSCLPLPPRDYLILFALHGGELHGYGIVKAAERESGGLVRMDPANLYRALKRMMGAGLVREALTRPAPDAHDERRRYFAITDFGHEVLTAEAARLERLAIAARTSNLIPDTGHTP